MAVAGRRPDTVKVRRQDEFCDGMFCFIIVHHRFTIMVSLGYLVLGWLTLAGWLAERLLIRMYLCEHVLNGYTHTCTHTHANTHTWIS